MRLTVIAKGPKWKVNVGSFRAFITSLVPKFWKAISSSKRTEMTN